MEERLKRERNNYLLEMMIVFFGMLAFSASAQNISENTVRISTKEGWYNISIPNEDAVETTFTPKDSISAKTSPSDSLFVELGSASENITLSTAPVSDTLKIDTESLKIFVIKDPFSINYDFDDLWYNISNGKKFNSGSTYSTTDGKTVIPKLSRAGSITSSVKTEREELWQIHYVFDAKEKEKKEKLCPEDFNAPAAKECINVSYTNLGKEINIEVSSTSSRPTVDELEFIIHGLENSIQFVWLNNIKYTPKNFLHQGMQIIPLRFDNPKNVLRLELK